MNEAKELVRAHYDAWAPTYGDAADDGWFAWVRAREERCVHRLINAPAGAPILDAGCGSGVYAKALRRRGHPVWAIDFAPEMVERVRGHVDCCLQADVEEIALGRTFACVLCLGVLEWVDRPGAVIERLACHLRPGGRLILLVPRTGPGGWIYVYRKRSHGLSPRLYRPRELRRLGQDAGLRYVAREAPTLHSFVMAFDAPRGGGRI